MFPNAAPPLQPNNQFFAIWNAWMATTLNAWSQMAMAYVGMWQSTWTGAPGYGGQSPGDIWSSWLSTAMQPVNSMARQMIGTPTVAFRQVIANPGAPQPETVLSAIAIPGIIPVATDLVDLSNSSNTIAAADHLQVQVSPDGQYLTVTITNATIPPGIGGNPPLPPVTSGFNTPGRYVGYVYCMFGQQQAVLANILLDVV
jgi:hypothetical protein